MNALGSFFSSWNARRCFAAARQHEQTGNYAAAARCYQQCLESAAGAFEAAFNLAVCLTKLEQWEEALRAYDRAAEIRSAFEGVWLNKGLLLQRLGRLSDAMGCFDRALQVQPTYVKAIRAKAQLLLQQRNNTEARRCIEVAREQAPEDEPTLWVYIAWLVAEKRYEDAHTQLTALLQRNPLHAQRRVLLEQVQYKIAHPDSPDIAMPPLLDPPPTEAERNLVEEGLLQGLQGADVAARATAREAVSRHPDSGQAWLVRGILLQQHRDYAGALDALERAVAAAPTDAQAHCVRGECLARLARYAEAVEAFVAAERYGWRRPYLYRNLAICLGRLGREHEARVAAAKAVALDPTLASTLPAFPSQSAGPWQDEDAPLAEGRGEARAARHATTKPRARATLLQMLLWVQLLRRGLFRKLLHFYGTLWVVASLCTAISLGLLLVAAQDMPAQYGPSWSWPWLALGVLLGGYAIGTLQGPVSLRLLSILLPVLILSTPGSGGAWQWVLMGRGALVFSGLLVLTVAAYLLAPFPYHFLGYAGWPHRRAMALVMLATGSLGLELLRVATRFLPTVMFPWSGTLTRLFDTPVWAPAIALWLWLNLACLLATYDPVLLPPLLRRLGYRVPDQLTMAYADLVDKLAESLRYRDDL